jgi:hypothetical protein
MPHPLAFASTPHIEGLIAPRGYVRHKPSTTMCEWSVAGQLSFAEHPAPRQRNSVKGLTETSANPLCAWKSLASSGDGDCPERPVPLLVILRLAIGDELGPGLTASLRRRCRRGPRNNETVRNSIQTRNRGKSHFVMAEERPLANHSFIGAFIAFNSPIRAKTVIR